MSEIVPWVILAEITKQVPADEYMHLDKFLETLNDNKDFLSSKFLEFAKVGSKRGFHWKFFKPCGDTEEHKKVLKEICAVVESIKNPKYILRCRSDVSSMYPGLTYYVYVVITPVPPAARMTLKLRKALKKKLRDTIVVKNF